MICPLCFSSSINNFCHDRFRSYFLCGNCSLIFADPGKFLSPAKEKARYDTHRNNLYDPGYRQLLSRLAEPLSVRLGDRPLEGLDFGSGPGPALSVIMRKKGYSMALYDPYYADNPAVLKKQYDFITCTETMEHFYNPDKEWRLLLKMLKPGGWLGIMTKLVTDEVDFAQWYYKNDLTHVAFFSRKTFRYLAKRDNLKLEFIGDDVILLQNARHTAEPAPVYP